MNNTLISHFLLGRLRARGVGSWVNGSWCFCHLLGLLSGGSSSLLSSLLAPFQSSVSQTFPPPPDNKLAYFPNLPTVQGTPAYLADQRTACHTQEDQDLPQVSIKPSNSYSWHFYHLLSPWNLLWIWSNVITRVSKAPIWNFLTCFEIPSAIIIYDNSCKLHQYILNRHPSHFKNTSDHFHWRGHVGCTSGYSLDSYTTPWIASINSQVNKQANARLQWINGQIAYLKPENFMFHV